MPYVPDLMVGALTFAFEDRNGNAVPVATTSVVPNNRGGMGRLSTQFAPGMPAESETIPGVGAWKKGEILAQHQMHDGRGKCRLVATGAVDGDGGLSWVIDSTTVAESGSRGQEESAPLVINVGEAKGTYLVLHADGRLKFRRGDFEYLTTIDRLSEVLARNE